MSYGAGKVVPMKPGQTGQTGQTGYAVGADAPAAPRPGISAGKTILIAAVSAAAGAVLIKMLDKTVFAQDDAEIGDLKAQLAAQAGPRALAPAAPAVAPERPPPGYVRIDVPRETMTDEFWARLAGEIE